MIVIRRLLTWLFHRRPRTLAELSPLERMARLNMAQTTVKRWR